jgi:hypothetical protein
MSLTTQQRATLKAAILAEPALAEPLSIRNDQVISEYCNAPTAQRAWRSSYTDNDLFSATDINLYIARSVAERQAYDLLITIGEFDPRIATIRSGIVNIFSGTAQNIRDQRATVLNSMTRMATWAEQLFGGTNATTDTVAAWLLNWEGTLSPNDISGLLNE